MTIYKVSISFFITRGVNRFQLIIKIRIAPSMNRLNQKFKLNYLIHLHPNLDIQKGK